MNPNLSRLQIFREVVVAGSFSKAALILKQPKSRVSRHIAALESEMGVQLIYRTTRQFQLTQAGRELYERVAPLILELGQAVDDIHSEGDEMSGTIRVTVPIDVGSELIGPFCFDFMKIYPKIQFSVVVTNEYIDLVKESIDVALRIGKNKDSSLIQKKIGSVGMIALMSPELLAKHGGLVRVENLESIPCVAFSTSDVKKVAIRLQRGRESRTLHLATSFSCNNFFTVRAMTIAGAGVTFLPAYLATEALQKGELVQVLKDWATEKSQVHLMIPNQKARPEKIKRFVEFLGQRMLPFL